MIHSRVVLVLVICLWGTTSTRGFVSSSTMCTRLLTVSPRETFVTSMTVDGLESTSFLILDNTLRPTISASFGSLSVWIGPFATSHIGMSAIRSTLIASFGQVAHRINLVGHRSWRLPEIWPGDDVGGREIWPDAATAGRQLYRAAYTVVSFTTLGNAWVDYLALRRADNIEEVMTTIPSPTIVESILSPYACWWVVASVAFGLSIASLFNPSPLSLVPGFTSTTTRDATSSRTALSLTRQDSLKLIPRGLTRITRHPLILPVVPWGVATAVLLGQHPADWILWGGLGLYALVGCAAQDLRISRQEGSVGTVFGLDGSNDSLPSSNSEAGATQSALQDFYASSSYVPFAAIADGRQSWDATIREFPILAFLFGCLVGLVFEAEFVHWLVSL